MDTGADETNRTSDLLITNQLLYQLSYISQNMHHRTAKIANEEPSDYMYLGWDRQARGFY